MTAAAVSIRGRRLPWHAGGVLRWLGLAAFVAIVFGPLFVLLVDTVRFLATEHPAATFTRVDALQLVVPAGRRLPLLARSVGLAGAVAVGGVATSVLVATVLARWSTGWASYLRWLVLALAPVPAYVHALAWQSAMFSLNGLLSAHGLGRVPFDGLAASWWVQLMSSLPLAVGLSLVAIESVSTELTSAARLLRPDWVVLTRVTLPLASPMILAGAGLLVLLSLLDYSVPALFQVNVYSLAVFAEYSATNEPSRALLMALPLLLVAAGVVVLCQAGLRRAAWTPRRREAAVGTAHRWPAWLKALQALALLVLAGHLLVPLVGLTTTVVRAGQFGATVSAARSEVENSTSIALAVALASLPLALAAARPLLRADAKGRAWWLTVTAPLAVPAPLVGIGLIALWNRPPLDGVYGTVAMPVLASLARFLPLAAIVVFVQLRHIHPDLVDAARLFQTGPLHGWLRVRLPMLLPGLLAGAAVAFALSLGELGATLIVVPPGFTTLSIKIYNYLHYGASDTVAGLCLVMAFVAALAGALAVGLVLMWSRLTGTRGTEAGP